jgi:hypothetical protein
VAVSSDHLILDDFGADTAGSNCVPAAAIAVVAPPSWKNCLLVKRIQGLLSVNGERMEYADGVKGGTSCVLSNCSDLCRSAQKRFHVMAIC